MAKKQRAEDMLGEAQRAKIFDLYLAGYRLEMIADRFGIGVDLVNLTLTLLRKERRNARAALTDWAAEFNELNQRSR